MIDADNCEFQKGTVLYKKILDQSLVKEINQFVDDVDVSKIPLSGTLAHRAQIKDIPDSIISQVKYAIDATLHSYSGDLEIGSMRIYQQEFGDIKPHFDVAQDGKSNITCLIYLTDGYEGGELNVKVKRTVLDTQPDKKHFLFNIKPQAGNAIIFKKSYWHYANEVFGIKRILLIDLKSDFLL